MIRNFIWDFFGKISAQLSAFIVSIILTRLLNPDEYGILGMSMVIIAISGAFLNLGFSGAIVQQKEINPLQLSTVFYLNLFIGILLFLLCFSLAGIIAEFYRQPQVKPIFRALSFTFIITSLNIVPSSLLYRQMKFKLITIFGVISTVVSGIVGIIMAYNGYGVWSLVAQTLSSVTIVLILTQSYIRFLPVLKFSFVSIKPLWNYGSKMFASSLLDNFFTRIDVFIIGKLFTPTTLGLYTRAQTLEVFVRQISSGSIASVLFPYLSQYQDNQNFIRAQFIRYLNLIMFISVGLSGLLFVIAEDLFVFLFSEKWLTAGTYFRIMAMAAFIWPVSNLMCTLISAMGNSRAFLRLEILKKILLIPVYGIGFLWGIEEFIYCLVGSFYGALLLNSIFVNKQIAVSVSNQFAIISKYFLAGVFAASVVFFLFTVLLNDSTIIFRLIVCGTAFVFLYLGLVSVSRLPAWINVIELLTKARKKFL